MRDEVAALRSQDDFLGLWKSADPDLPIYKEAKTEDAAIRMEAR